MRIFKNRGDIYISKINKKKSAEQRILIGALIFIIIFTIIFVSIISFKNDFSAKKFFKPEDINISSTTQVQEEQLPQISGKSNYFLLVHSDDEVLFCAMVQCDSDNTSYKASVFKADTVIQGQSIASIYKNSGIQNVKSAIENVFSNSVDYYISIDNRKFVELIDDMGEIKYSPSNEIKYKSKNKDNNYTLRLKAGEQILKGEQVVKLIRYYSDEFNDNSLANDVFLSVLSQISNEDNYTNKDELFKNFIEYAETNITVRDFSIDDDKLKVFTSKKTNVGVYSAVCEYNNNELNDNSVQKAKSYFVKN